MELSIYRIASAKDVEKKLEVRFIAIGGKISPSGSILRTFRTGSIVTLARQLSEWGLVGPETWEDIEHALAVSGAWTGEIK
jgi:hypothetical protein